MKAIPSLLASMLMIGSAGATHAQGLKAMKPLSGYACMVLNLTQDQLTDNSVVVPIMAGPSGDAPKVANAAATIIATSPLHVVNGYAEVLRLNGQPGWIEADKLKPFHSESDPNARCTPSLMSNGKPGFG